MIRSVSLPTRYVDYSAHLNEYWGTTVKDLHKGFANVIDGADTYSTYYFRSLPILCARLAKCSVSHSLICYTIEFCS